METVDFVFDPNEVNVVSTFEFVETVQRPSSLQFFPIEEQLEDAYIRIASKRGKVNRFVEREIRTQVENIHTLYKRYIVATSDAYELNETFTHPVDRTIPWISPIYATDTLNEYSFEDEWAPLTTERAYAERNGYNRLLLALPHPYASSTEGVPWESTVLTKMVSGTGEKPMYVLPAYSLTRSVFRDNGTMDIVSYDVANTADASQMIGYYAFERPLPIPNPLPGHPLLESNLAKRIDVTAPLNDVLPTLDAVMTHAVPVTTDPYGVGQSHLTPFGFTLSDIPWATWKSRFPPSSANAEQTEQSMLPLSSASFIPDIVKKLGEMYGSPYKVGVAIREWLLRFVDGGGLMPRLLLSQVGDNGTITGLNQPYIEFQPPAATPEDCLLTGLSFHEFVSRGVVRVDKNGKKTCVPTDTLRQEQGRLGYLNRSDWNQQTPTLVVQTYQRLLHAYTKLGRNHTETTEPMTPIKALSTLRMDVLVIVGDPRRLPEDKLQDVKTLLSNQNAVYDNHMYFDTDGQFVFCDHAVAVLSGELEKDERLFYTVWTKIHEGTRVCQFCSEVLSSDVFVDAEEFTENGQRIRTSEILHPQRYNFAPQRAQDANMLRKSLDAKSPFQDTLHVSLLLLRILPSYETLHMYTLIGSAIESQLRGKQPLAVQGMVGLAIACLLIQSSDPPLVPKRTIGTKPLVWTGYPVGKKEDFHIVDSLLAVFQRTFTAIPSFTGTSADTIQTILTKKATVRTGVIQFIDAIVKKNTAILDQIKLNLAKAPEAPPPEQAVLLQEVRPQKTPILTSPHCGVVYGFLSPESPPTYRLSGKEVEYQVSTHTPQIVHKHTTTHRSSYLTIQTVKEMTKKMTKPTEWESLVLTEDWTLNAILLDRICAFLKLPAQSVQLNPSETASVLRDTTKAMIWTLIRSQTDTDRIRVFLETDPTVRIVSADVKKQQKHTATLRASERHLLTKKLQMKNDMEREITKTLIDIGLADYLVTREDRIQIAAETEYEEDVGPEVPVEREEGVLPFEGANEAGNYGDIPAEWESDVVQPTFFDEE